MLSTGGDGSTMTSSGGGMLEGDEGGSQTYHSKGRLSVGGDVAVLHFDLEEKHEFGFSFCFSIFLDLKSARPCSRLCWVMHDVIQDGDA